MIRATLNGKGNLSRSHFKIGKMMLLAGRHEEARASFRKSLPIVERLAAADPDNVEWQKDLINNLVTSASASDNYEAQFNRGLDIISRLNAEGKLSDLEVELYTNALKQAFNLE